MKDSSYKIYNASAGSGKTFTLVKAYLKILLASDNPRIFRKVLAITFTNKAVNEMKTRILQSLYDFSISKPLNQHSELFNVIAEELNLSKPSLEEKSKIILKNILHNYAFFDVSTIDKFTHRLIRTFAKDLKLPQNFEVVLDTDRLLDEAVGRLISKAGTDKKLTNLLVAFALEKIDDDKSWDITFDLNRVGKLLFNENHTPHLKKISAKSIDDFLALRTQTLRQIKTLDKEASDLAEAVLESIKKSGLSDTDFPYQTLPNHFKKIASGNFDVKKLYENTLEQKIEDGKIFKASVNLPPQSITDQIGLAFKTIKEILFRRAYLENIYINVVPLTVLGAIQQEMNTLQDENELLPISYFNTLISNEIKNQPAPYIYERIGEKYRHYFIDEFQDTSLMQWENLIPLISNALAGEDLQGKSGSLLLVGDIKQSIYRWRGGKAEQFMKLINELENPFSISPDVQNLSSNYRSRKEIIQFNNDFFTTTSPYLNQPSFAQLFVDGNNQNFNEKEGGLVHIEFVDSEDRPENDQYCERVLQTIQEVRKNGYAHRDICILTRKKKEGVVLADFLMSQEIPILSSETLLLAKNNTVVFLINLLSFSIHPQNGHIAFEILNYLLDEDENKHSVIQKHLLNCHQYLNEHFGFDFKQLFNLSVYDSMEYAIKIFGLAHNSDAFISFLLDEVLDIERKQDPGIHTFLNHWENKKEHLSIVAPEHIDAVHIMTIHKAKGLEFPIVLFPFANTSIYDERNPKLWLAVDPESSRGFEELLLSKKQELLNYPEPSAVVAYENEQHKLELDAFNLLYVALTRSIDALYVFTVKDLTSKGALKANYSGVIMDYLQQKSMWNDEVNTYSFGFLPHADKKRESGTSHFNIPYQYSYKQEDKIKIITEGGMRWDTDREQAIIKGTLLHYIMGYIHHKADVEPRLHDLVRLGEIQKEVLTSIRELVYGIVNHPQLEKYYQEEVEIKNEVDLIDVAGRVLRPDRLVFFENKATVIDYKFGKKDPRYHEQLYGYSDALEGMGYQVENRIIVYINKEVSPEFI